MTLKQQNPWKLLSVGLLGVIAIGLLTPINATPPSGGSSNQIGALWDAVAQLTTDLTTEATTRADADTALQSQIDEKINPEDWVVYTNEGSLVSIGSGESKVANALCDDYNDIAISGSNSLVGSLGASQNTFIISSKTNQPECILTEELGWQCTEGSYNVLSKNTHDSESIQSQVTVTCLEIPGTGDPTE